MDSVLADDASFDELKTILSDAFREVAPLESPDFEEPRATLLERQSPSSLPAIQMRSFPGIVESSVLGLHLLSGTIALVEMYRSRKQRDDERKLELEIREEWIRALIEAGMSRELAELIPVKRSADMIRFLTRQRFKDEEH